MEISDKCIPVFFLVGIIILVSGCVSQFRVDNASPNFTPDQPREVSTPQYIVDNRNWIQINPISDFETESPFNVTGATNFNITGTTNFPAGSLFWVKIIEEERSRDVVSERLVTSSVNSNGVNTFSYPFDIQGNPPAHYRVEIRKANQNFTATEQFKIILIPSKERSLWVHIDPVRWNEQDENLTITGTTTLSTGSEISLELFVWGHTCPTQPPGYPQIKNTEDYCNGGCNENVRVIVPVTKGNAGINSWIYTFNTTDWCKSERHVVNAEVHNWTNVTTDYQIFPYW